MFLKALMGITIPFVGTALGAACVVFLRNGINKSAEHILCGFAAGVMLAASVWSLIIPSLELSAPLGVYSFVPALVGTVFGFAFLIVVERLIHHFEMKQASMLALSVNIHNLPEGMAVGVVYAGWLAGLSELSFSAAIAVSIGIAIQNIPEGAIISMPLYSGGMSKGRAYLQGLVSAVIEPLGALLTIVFYAQITTALPYLLSFAAGAMLYVVFSELIPKSNDEHSQAGAIMFAVGFCFMMVLDVTFS